MAESLDSGFSQANIASNDEATSPENGTISEELEQLSCFSPRVLRRQLLEEMVVRNGSDGGSEFHPSLKKFHGALLFVDISGFTQLSQKLDVDNLRKFINAYFKKLIDIVNKYDGEVIKFAGDAMYIVWQTTFSESDSSQLDTLGSVSRAADCAVEIIRVCSNYRVETAGPTQLNRLLSTARLGFGNNRLTVQGPSNNLPRNPVQESAFATYLNVHCGLSVGMMAGIDIGADNRWEYFIVGDPLREVALAEEHAEKGQVAMSSVAHSILHPDDNQMCSCVKHESGLCWILSSSPTDRFSIKSSFKKASSWMLSNDRLRVQLDADTMKMRTEMQEDVSMAVDYAKYTLAMEKFCGNANHITAADFDPVTKDRQFRGRLIHRLLAHTHEVMRNEHDAGDDNLFQQQSDSGFGIGDNSSGQRSLLSSNLFDLPPLIESSPGASSGRNNPQRKDSIAVRRLKQLQRPDSATKQPSSYLRKGADMADQREVITLFINLQFRKDLSIASVDMASCSRSPFHFLQEHDPEKLAQDQQVLVQYQQCLKHIVLALHSSGGQLRQFIVDDKGTVAIGTFGLRGSVSRDIASSAIDVAQKIIDELQFVHLASASVGVTAGKVYNGLVGSPFRHEFAVMGPSVNMSARLMGKAPPNTVLCDDIVHSRDQVHQFVHFADVSAKGYDRPVPTFTPLSDSQLKSTQPNSNMMSHIAQHVEKHVVGNNDPLDADSTMPLTERMATPPSDDDIFIGRLSEIDQIEAYLSGSQHQELWEKVLRPQASELFLMLPSESSTTENASSSALSAVNADLLSSFLSTPTRVIILDGVHGIGKSHILQEISNRIARHLERVDFVSPVAIHSLPQRRLKDVEPFISFRPLLDTLMYRYADWVANRPFDPLAVVGFSRRTKTKILRGLSMLIGSLPLDVQVFAPLLRVFNKQYASDDNDVTKKLSPVDRTRHLSFFLFQLVQAFQRAINRVIVLNIDELYLMDRNTQQLTKELIRHGRGFVFMIASSAESASSDAARLVSSIKESCVSTGQEALCIHVGPLSALEIKNYVRTVQPGLTPATPGTGLIQATPSQSSPPPATLTGGGDDYTAMDRIMEMTGGNPLYLRELVKGITDPSVSFVVSSTSVVSPTSAGGKMDYISSALTRSTILRRVKKVEEVVAVRFDQLDHRSQLLLKVASVACAYGSNATAELLAQMILAFCEDVHKIFRLPTDDEESCRLGLIKSVQGICETLSNVGTFLTRAADIALENSADFQAAGEMLSPSTSRSRRGYSRRESTSSTAEASLGSGAADSHRSVATTSTSISVSLSSARSTTSTATRTSRATNVMSYNFRVDLEQQVIYGMLLQEQKVLLHGKVAEWYDSWKQDVADAGIVFDYSPKKSTRLSDTQSERKRQQMIADFYCEDVQMLHDHGLHNEAAGKSDKALTCYYRAGVRLMRDGAISDAQVFFEMALQMYENLKDACLTPTKSKLQGISQSRSHSNSKLDVTSRGPQDNVCHSNTGAEPPSHVSNIHSLLMDLRDLVGANKHDEGMSILSQPFSPVITRANCAQAFRGSNSLLEETIESMTYLIGFKGQGGMSTEDFFQLCEEALMLVVAAYKGPDSTDAFGLDHVTLALPIIFILVVAGIRLSPELLTKMRINRSLCASAMVDISRQCLNQPELQYHLIVSLSLLRGTAIEKLDFATSLRLEQEFIQYYDYDRMHTVTCDVYGYDQPVVSLVNILKFAYLRGDVPQMQAILQKLRMIDLGSMQYRTLEVFAVAMIAAYLLMERYDEAFFSCATMLRAMRQRAIIYDLHHVMPPSVEGQFLLLLLRMRNQQLADAVHIPPLISFKKDNIVFDLLITEVPDCDEVNRHWQPEVIEENYHEISTKSSILMEWFPDTPPTAGFDITNPPASLPPFKPMIFDGYLRWLSLSPEALRSFLCLLFAERCWLLRLQAMQSEDAASIAASEPLGRAAVVWLQHAEVFLDVLSAASSLYTDPFLYTNGLHVTTQRLVAAVIVTRLCFFQNGLIDPATSPSESDLITKLAATIRNDVADHSRYYDAAGVRMIYRELMRQIHEAATNQSLPIPSFPAEAVAFTVSSPTAASSSFSSSSIELEFATVQEQIMQHHLRPTNCAH